MTYEHKQDSLPEVGSRRSMWKSATVVGFLLLSAISTGAPANAALAKCGGEGMKRLTKTADCSNIATAQKPAIYLIQYKTGGAKALELTARPVGVEASSPYLVQVFVDYGAESKNKAPKLLGTFSFFPARIGQAQTFVLPKPALDDVSPSKELTLLIKLVSANTSRTLKDAAVEIMDARLDYREVAP